MRALPIVSTPSIPLRRALWVAVFAAALLGFGCGDDPPPGARPIAEAERAEDGAAPSNQGARSARPFRPPSQEGAAETDPAPAPPDAPRVVSVDPPNGAAAVDPSRNTLSVTFDREMDREGWAWVVEDEASAPEIGEASFDDSGRTNSVQVELEPGRQYVVWINSETYRYFKGADGTPAVPYRWTFRTRGAGDEEVALVSSRSGGAPRVVALDPPDGSTGVDPDRESISVTFDRAMEGSWAWVTEGGTTPPPTAGEPTFSADRRTNRLPVDLAPEMTYTIWINSDEHRLFRSTDGVPAEPVRWSFTTGPGS